MSSVDNRVVNMKFDNAQFEKNISQTLNSLDKLDKSLQLKNGTKGIDDVKRASNNFSLAGISEAVNSISKRFSTFGIIGMTALQNLTTTAMQTGKKMMNAITGPIIAGGKRRAQNIEQAKFQITGLGKKWEDVESDINYAVQDTAYGLDEAAKAASQFLASGVKEGDQMKRSLRAISGVAAMTNSQYSDIANIFTRVSGQGRVMAIDLNSLAARGLNAAAVLAKSMGKTEAEVREMTSKGQISFEMFAKAMDDAYGEHAKKANETFTGALSNMKAALARIGAEVAGPTYDSLKNVINAFTPVINTVKYGLGDAFGFINKTVSKFSNSIIKTLNKFGYTVDKNGNKIYKSGARHLIDGLRNIATALSNIWKFAGKVFKPIRKAFRDIFPKQSVSVITKFTRNFVTLTKRLKMSGETADRLRRIFRGLFATFSIAKTLIGRVINLFGRLWGSSNKVRGGFLEVAAKIGDFIVKIDEALKHSKVLTVVFDTLHNVFRVVANAFTAVGERFRLVFSEINKGAKSIDGGLLNKIKDLFIKVAEAINTFVDAVADRLLGNDMQKSSQALNKLMSGGILISFMSLKKALAGNNNPLNKILSPFDAIKNSINTISKSLSSIFTQLGNSVGAFNKKVKSEALLNVAKSLLMIAAAVFILSTIDEDSLMSSVVGMGALFTELALFMKQFGGGNSKSKISDASKMVKLSTALDAVGVAILLLAGSMKILASIPWDGIKKGLFAVGSLLSMLTGVVKLITNNEGKTKKMTKGITGLIGMAVAIRIMVKAVKSLSELSWDQLTRGLTGVGALIAYVTAFTKITSGSRKMVSIGIGMILLATAMEILLNVAWKFGQMDWESLAKAGLAIGVLLAYATAMSKLVKSGKLLVASAALVILASSMEILANVCKKFSQLGWEDIAKAGASLAGLIAIIVTFSRTVKSLKLTASVAGLLGFAATFTIVAKSMAVFEDISWGGLIRGIIALEMFVGTILNVQDLINPWKLTKNALGILAFSIGLQGFLKIFKQAQGMDWTDLMKIALSLGMLITVAERVSKIKDLKKLGEVAVAIFALAGAAVMLASLSWSGMGIALSTLAGMFIVLGVGLRILRPVIPLFWEAGKGMLFFSLAIATTGASMFILGLGILTFASGIAACVAAFAGGVDAAEALSNTIIPFGEALLKGLPLIVKAVMRAGEEIIDGAIRWVPKLVKLVFVAIDEIFENAAQTLPKIAKFIEKLVGFIIPIVNKYIPDLVNTLFDFLDTVLDILIKRVPDLVKKVVILIKVIFKAVFDELKGINPKSFAAAIVAFGALAGLFVIIAKMKKYAKDALTTALVMIVIFGSFTTMFLLLNLIDTDKMLNIAESLTVTMLALSAALFIASKIPASAAAEGMAVLAIAIGSITAIIAAMGAIKQIPGVDWLVSEGAEFMKKIGSAIGGFIGNIVGSFAEGVSDHLVAIADNLSDFMNHLDPFIKGAKNISNDSMDAVLKLAAVILALTASSLIDQISNFLGAFMGKKTSFADFGKELAEFGPYISLFGSQVRGLDKNSVDSASNAGLMLAALASALGREGGLLQGLIGERVKLSDFGKELVDFGPSLVKFARQTKNITKKSISGAVAAGKMLAGLNSEMPARGGLLQLITGEQITLPQFGKEIEGFMPHLKKAAQKAIGISPSAISGAAAAGEVLSKLSNGLPRRGGLVSLFVGDQISLTDFGSDIAGFVYSMSKGLSDLPDVDVNAVDKMVIVADTIKKFQGALGNKGGLIKDIADLINGKEISLPEIGSQLGQFLKNMYSEMSAGGFSNMNATKAAENAESLSNLAVKVMDLANALKSGNDNTKLGSYIIPLTSVINLLNKLSESSITKTDINKVKKAISSVFEITGSISENMVSHRRQFAKEIDWYINYGEDTFGGKGSIFKKYGKTIMKNWIDGVKSKKDTFKSVANWYNVKLQSFINDDGIKLKEYGAKYPQYIIDGLESPDKQKAFESALGIYKFKIKEFVSKQEGTWGKNIREKYKKLGSSIIGNLTKGISEKADLNKNGEFKKNSPMWALTKIFQSISDIANYSTEGEENPVYKFVKNLIDLFLKVNKASGDIDYDSLNNWKDWMTSLVSDLSKGLDGGKTSFSSALKWYENELKTFKTDQKTIWSGLGPKIIDNLVAGFNDIEKNTEFDSALNSISNKVTELGGTDEDLQTLLTNRGKNMLEWLTNGFTDEATEKKRKKFAARVDKIIKPLSEFGNYDSNGNLKSASKRLHRALKTRASNSISSLIDGLKDEEKRTVLKNTVDKLRRILLNLGLGGSNGKQGKTLLYDAFKRRGQYILEGLSYGIKHPVKSSAEYDPAIAMLDITKGIVLATDKSLDINSPSKVMQDKGKFIVMGMANGLTRFAYLAYNAAVSTSKKVEKGFDPLSKSRDDLIPDSFDLNPTITPVLDLSKIQNESSRISSLFDPVGIGLYGSNLLASKTAVLSNGQEQTSEVYDDTDLMNKIQKFYDGIVDMSNKIQNLQIVMDTGATVGALAPKMDNALGRIASRKERGI